MKGRVSKQIKLTHDEFERLQNLVVESEKTMKVYVGYLLELFIDSDTEEQLDFLQPTKSGNYRCVWIDKRIAEKVKEFAVKNDISQNTVIFTAIKRNLNEGKKSFQTLSAGGELVCL